MFTRESEFEAYLRGLIQNKICTKNSNLKLFKNKKAVDILICRNGKTPKLFFIEVKFHKKSHGRMGFGGTKGKGFQPEIVATKPDYFEDNLRWILGSEDDYKNNMQFVSSSVIRQYLSGGKVAEKHNNIQKKIFKEVQGFDEDGLVRELKKWLKS